MAGSSEQPEFDKLRALWLAVSDLPESERSQVLDKADLDDVSRLALRLLAHDTVVSDRTTAAGSPAIEPSESLLGGRYRLGDRIGQGGQATVFKAEDTLLNRTVAMKVMSPWSVASGDGMARFRREAEITSQLDHPGICSVLDTGDDEGCSWIAMRYVEGDTLADRVKSVRNAAQSSGGDEFFDFSLVSMTEEDTELQKRRTTMSRSVTRTRDELAEVVHLIEKIARALHVAHEAGIVHRDIKPGNIMITSGGEPVILDFGLAHVDAEAGAMLTRTGDVFGTPAYMAPEQVTGNPDAIDRRTDVYALGVTLFEVVTMRRPFEAATRDQLYQDIRLRRAPDPRKINSRISGDLSVVIATAMEKEPGRRYSTAEDLADELQRIREHQPIVARPVGPHVRAWLWARRNPKVASLAAALFLTLVTGLVVVTGQNADLAVQKRIAEQSRAAAELEAFRANLSAARTNLQLNDSAGAREFLGRIREQDRGWIWRHLDWLADRSLMTVDVGEPTTAAFGADDTIWVGTRDGLLRQYSIATGAMVAEHRLDLPHALVYIFASADGRRLLLRLKPTFPALFDTENGVVLWTKDWPASCGDNFFDGDKLLLPRYEGREYAIVDPMTGAETWRETDDYFRSSDWNPDRRELLVNLRTRGVGMLDPETGKFRSLGEEEAHLPSWTLDGRHLLLPAAAAGKRTILADVEGRVIAKMDGAVYHYDHGTRRSWATDTRFTSAVAIHDVRRGRTDLLLGHGAQIVGRGQFERERYLTLDTSGVVKVWSADAGPAVPSLSFTVKKSIASADGNRIFGVQWGRVQAWDTRTLQRLWASSEYAGFAECAALSPDGARLAVGGSDGVVIFEAATGEVLVRSGKTPGWVSAMAVAPGGSTVWAGTRKGGLVTVDAGTGAVTTVADVELPIVEIEFAPDGAEFVVGAGRRWGVDESSRDGAGGGRLDRFTPGGALLGTTLLEAPVSAVAYDGDAILAGDATGRIHRQDPQAGDVTEVADVESRILDLMLIDGRIAAGTTSGVVLCEAETGIALFRHATPTGVDTIRRDERTDAIIAAGHSFMIRLETGPPPEGWRDRERSRLAHELAHDLLPGDGLLVDAMQRLEAIEGLEDDLAERTREALRRLGEWPNQLNSLAWGIVRVPESSEEDLARALRASRRACELIPTSWPFANTLSVALLRSGSWQEALAESERSLALREALAPGDPHAGDLLTRAWCLFELDREAEARTEFERARSLCGEKRYASDRETLGFLAEVEARFGD